jgi:tripartite-type tricarboxylate transporter receptor subunit TctC
MPLLLRSTMAFVMVLLALSWLSAAGARAQDFPTRVIRVVVAFPAGGPTDFVARILADKLKPLLGQSVVVENKPGANGAISCSSPRSARSRSRRIWPPRCLTTRSGISLR